jgi:hypothetical protein
MLLKSLVLSLFFISSCGDSDSTSSAVTEDSVTLKLTDVFSTDFVHPKLAGQIIIANLVIKNINDLYSASVPFIKFKLDENGNHVSTISDDMLTPTSVDGLDTIIFLGDSLTSGYEAMSDSIHLFTENSFGILVARQLNIDGFRYPQTTLGSPGVITNSDSTDAFHLLALPSGRVKDLTLSDFSAAAAGGDLYVASLLETVVPLWQQVLRHAGAGAGKSAMEQMSDILPSEGTPLVVINTGNNDLLSSATYELLPPTSVSDFQTEYEKIVTKATTKNSNTKFVLFNIANIGAAPALKSNIAGEFMSTAGGALNSYLSTIPTLYGSTNTHLSPVDQTLTPYPSSNVTIKIASDWIKLTSLTDATCFPAGAGTQATPLPDGCWLDSSEQTEITTIYDGYQNIIETIVSSDNDKRRFTDTKDDLVNVVNNGTISEYSFSN